MSPLLVGQVECLAIHLHYLRRGLHTVNVHVARSQQLLLERDNALTEVVCIPSEVQHV